MDPLFRSALLVSVVMAFVSSENPAQAGHRAPSAAAIRRARVKMTPAQVWALVRSSYLKRDFETLYAQYSSEDQKKAKSFAKFRAKLERYYDKKFAAFRALKFAPGKAKKGKDGRRYFEFGFKLPSGKAKRQGGRMVWQKNGWRLYKFH